MSGRCTGWVLKHGPRDRAMRAVLITIADAANADGQHAHPGVKNIVEGSLYSRAHVLRTIGQLVEEGWLEVEQEGGGRGQATTYSVQMEHLETVSPVDPLSEKQSHSVRETVSSEAETVSSPYLELTPTVSPTVNPNGKKERKARKPNPIWDAYAEATHTHPQTDSERGMWAKAFKELRGADATPAQVRARIGAWAMKYPNAHLTPIALAKHWGSLGPPDLVQYVAEPEVAHPNSERTVAEIQALKQMLRRIP